MKTCRNCGRFVAERMAPVFGWHWVHLDDNHRVCSLYQVMNAIDDEEIFYATPEA